MKKIIIALFSIIMLFNPISAQVEKLIGPPGGWALKVAMNPSYPNIVYSGDYGGAVFVTEDGGLTTRPVETGYRQKLVNKIAIPQNSEDLCYISYTGVMDAERVYLRSMDKGKTWCKIQTSGRYVGHITFNPLNPDIVFIVKNDKEIWRSNDKGDNWKLVYNFANRLNYIIISSIDTSLFYAAADASIYKSVNSGHEWARTYFSEEAFAPVKMTLNNINNNSLIVQKIHSPNPGLYKTTDGGVSFEIIYDGVLNDFVINPIDTLIIYGASGELTYGQEGGIIKSIDGGKNWIAINNGLGDGVVVGNTIDINPQNLNELYAGVSQKGVYKTVNGGENWSLSNLNNSSVSITSISEDNYGAILTGYLNGLIKTTDYGKTWYKPSFDTTNLNSVSGITFSHYNNKIGMLSKSNGLFSEVFKTIDEGENWSYTETLEPIGALTFHKFIDNVVFAASRKYVYKSIDGGESFYQVPFGAEIVLDDTDAISKFIFSSDNINRIYAMGYDSIYVSNDIGESWHGIKIPNSSILGNNDLVIRENNPNILYCAQLASFQSLGHLKKSNNAGETWFNIDSSLKLIDPFCSASSILLDENSNKIYVGLLSFGDIGTGSVGGLYLTEDEGKNWMKIYDGEVSLIRADKSQPRNIYFGTKFGLMHLVDTLNVTAIKKEEKLIKNNFYLHQNYPNPFNPSTTIKYSIPNNTVMLNSFQHLNNSEIPNQVRDDNVNVKLIVYDILGREVTTLVNQKQKPGNYEVEFNARNLTSGIYFYRITAGNPASSAGQVFVETKKMILLK